MNSFLCINIFVNIVILHDLHFFCASLFQTLLLLCGHVMEAYLYTVKKLCLEIEECFKLFGVVICVFYFRLTKN